MFDSVFLLILLAVKYRKHKVPFSFADRAVLGLGRFGETLLGRFEFVHCQQLQCVPTRVVLGEGVLGIESAEGESCPKDSQESGLPHEFSGPYKKVKHDVGNEQCFENSHQLWIRRGASNRSC